MKNVENKVIIITGASSGIGEETARVLAANGAKVVLSARREDRLQKLCEEIGENAAYLPSDVTSLEDAIMCLDEIVKVPFIRRRYNKYLWLKNLTRETELI